jgi:cytochrome c556
LRADGQAGRITVATHEGYMKTLSSTNTALAAKVKVGDLAGAAKDAQQIAATFGDIEKFWTENKKTDAVTWAQQGKQSASDAAAALSAGDATKADAARKQMSGSCNSCHMTYREGTPQTGGYTIKAGIVTP